MNENNKAKRADVLNKLTKQAQELDMGYEANEADSFQQMLRERKEALLSGDIRKVKDFADKYEIKITDDPFVLVVAMHKARAGLVDIPKKERKKSKRWLEKHKFSPHIGKAANL